MTVSPNITKAGWSVDEFVNATSICRTLVFSYIKSGKIKSVSVGRRRVITTPPADFLASLATAA
jgi:hypothetical protein